MHDTIGDAIEMCIARRSLERTCISEGTLLATQEAQRSGNGREKYSHTLRHVSRPYPAEQFLAVSRLSHRRTRPRRAVAVSARALDLPSALSTRPEHRTVAGATATT